MKRLFLTLLAAAAVLMGIAGTAQAGDTAHYYDPDRSGEGMTLFRNNRIAGGDLIHFILYTYEPEQGCYHITIPYYQPVDEGNCHESRWFASGAAHLFTDNNGNKTATGALLCPFGIDYPDGIPVINDPFARIVGEAYRCADFYLESFQGGWRLVLDRFGTILEEDDPLFDRVFEFTDIVFLGAD